MQYLFTALLSVIFLVGSLRGGGLPFFLVWKLTLIFFFIYNNRLSKIGGKFFNNKKFSLKKNSKRKKIRAKIDLFQCFLPKIDYTYKAKLYFCCCLWFYFSFFFVAVVLNKFSCPIITHSLTTLFVVFSGLDHLQSIHRHYWSCSPLSLLPQMTAPLRHPNLLHSQLGPEINKDTRCEFNSIHFNSNNFKSIQFK